MEKRLEEVPQHGHEAMLPIRASEVLLLSLSGMPTRHCSETTLSSAEGHLCGAPEVMFLRGPTKCRDGGLLDVKGLLVGC